MPAFVLALYGQPTDPKAFADYIESEHVPLVRKVDGVQSIRISEGPAFGPDGSEVFHRVGMLEFESFDALQAALNSAEGQEAAADLENFASGGATLAVFATRDITSP